MGCFRVWFTCKLFHGELLEQTVLWALLSFVWLIQGCWVTTNIVLSEHSNRILLIFHANNKKRNYLSFKACSILSLLIPMRNQLQWWAVPVYARGFGTRKHLRSLPTRAVLWKVSATTKLCKIHVWTGQKVSHTASFNFSLYPEALSTQYTANDVLLAMTMLYYRAASISLCALEREGQTNNKAKSEMKDTFWVAKGNTCLYHFANIWENCKSTPVIFTNTLFNIRGLYSAKC